MRDLYSNDVETAAYLAREEAAWPWDSEWEPEPPERIRTVSRPDETRTEDYR